MPDSTAAGGAATELGSCSGAPERSDASQSRLLRCLPALLAQVPPSPACSGAGCPMHHHVLTCSASFHSPAFSQAEMREL